MSKTFKLLAGSGLAWLMLSTAPASAAAANLLDGTIVHVRLLSPITSEDSKAGDRIRFVVTKDVIADGVVIIARKTSVAGTVTAARRASWGFIWHRAVLAFAFDQTTAVNGQTVTLRSRTPSGQVTINRSNYHHNLQWANGGDTFEASVAGNYNFRVE